MKLFITGIGTDVGKTITSAIVTQALEADYWKPIQAGDLDNSDSHKIQRYICSDKTVIHENSYKLKTPASPHLAAAIDGITIDLKKIIEPSFDNALEANHLIIEGAGGLLVPLNDNDTIIDLIQPDYKIILVSRHYLGSINHTLLSFEALKSRNLNVAGIIFSGNENKATEEIILNKTKAKFIGRIDDEPYFDQNVIQYYADKFRENLLNL
ncbi:dethiobiotin synthase [Flavobacterium sp.]|uniref:dethiobiotin synthase n=1 Tax=Flavobacterium sp. TaxID=239 RepID=UPI00261E401B|nr:dethiobiotin synthase [Flavobacterium sp.]